MQYKVIVDGQLVTATKVTERNHWLWGRQWLMEWGVGYGLRKGEVLYKECGWFKPSKVFEVTSEAKPE